MKYNIVDYTANPACPDVIYSGSFAECDQWLIDMSIPPGIGINIEPA